MVYAFRPALHVLRHLKGFLSTAHFKGMARLSGNHLTITIQSSLFIEHILWPQYYKALFF